MAENIGGEFNLVVSWMSSRSARFNSLQNNLPMANAYMSWSLIRQIKTRQTTKIRENDKSAKNYFRQYFWP